MNEFKVGQQVFVVWAQSRYGRTTTETIESIGRKWVNLADSHYRFDKEKMFLDGGDYSSPGKVYLTKNDWVAEKQLNDAWYDFRSKMQNYQYPTPANLTVEKINQAMELLGLPITKKVVKIEGRGWNLCYDLDAAKAAVAPFEIDGWKAKIEDFQDADNYVGETHVKVTFEREI